MKTIIAAIACICLLIACNDKANRMMELESLKGQAKTISMDEKRSPETDGLVSDTTVPVSNANEDKEKKKQPNSSKEITHEDWDKKIIKTASLDLEVKDFNAYYDRLRENVRAVGGYIAQEEQNESSYKIENTLVIKVPVDQFENALARVSSNVEKLNEKKISSQDVTTEYVDTRSRLESKKQVRLRYLDLLKQAKNMDEVLNVQSEINDIQEEIESATGRIDYLSHSSAFSTINLTYYQVLNASAKNADKPSFGTKVVNAFSTGWGWIVELFVGIVSIWPLLLLGFICVILYRKTRIRKLKEV